MPGKFCYGASRNNSFLPKSTKAFSEGVYYRSSGTAAAKPLTNNPHVATTSAGIAWIAGWNVSNNASPGAIAQSAAPCVAIPHGNISA